MSENQPQTMLVPWCETCHRCGALVFLTGDIREENKRLRADKAVLLSLWTDTWAILRDLELGDSARVTQAIAVIDKAIAQAKEGGAGERE